MGNWKRILVACVLLLSVVGACRSDKKRDADREDTSGSVRFSTKATTIADQLIANDWAAVRVDFDETMEAQLGELQLQTAWQQATGQLGAYKSRGEPSRYKTTIPNIETFEVPLTFESGALKVRVSFHADGSVAGLYLLDPNVP